eukprot:TRINITY_DN8400_c0_g1_i1.p1 TRINITY_DN8400_c0_g1~~TRINITY_DN8400_c0_g1_i1.p1  ORF type:complete len:408 (-),score=72.13 TRINITY_DN8400_c0_g1_i1:128-1234(-)
MGNNRKKKRQRNREQINKTRKNKQNERRIKQHLRDQRNRVEYGGSSWVQDMKRFNNQIRSLGLAIKDVAGDGNCLFRAIGDQIEGNPNCHRKIRNEICDFMERNRFDYEPFVEDDEPFERYIPRMRSNATWGGQLEIQAASVRYVVNIIIHQLDQPRWEVINFSPDTRTIHLSYHDGDHYNSVRLSNDMGHGIPRTINLVDSKKAAEEIIPSKLTPDAELVITLTGCENVKFVLQVLDDHDNDTDASITFIYDFGVHDIESQYQYIGEPIPHDHSFYNKVEPIEVLAFNEEPEDDKKPDQRAIIEERIHQIRSKRKKSNKENKELVRLQKELDRIPKKQSNEPEYIDFSIPHEIDTAYLTEDLGSLTL